MSLKDKTYEILKDRIVNCIYPPGTLLKEREVIEALGVSRTPFREAIVTLMQEGLVQIVPYQGILVAEITRKDIEALYAVRERLELYALELCMERIPWDVLQVCYDGVRTGVIEGRAEAMRQDEDVHTMILCYANNKLLKRLMDGLNDHMHRVRVLSTTQDQDIQCTREEHLGILEAIRDGDVEAASAAMRAHIQRSKERALNALLKDNSKLYFRM